MKKTLLNILMLSVISIIFFAGCNISYEPTSLSVAPTVAFKGNSITISVPKKTNTVSYINIYRQDVTDNQEQEEEIIGVIYPKYITTEGSVYIFYDEYITKNRTYRYRVRYTDYGEYISSKWSEEITAKDGYSEETTLAYNISSGSSKAKFSYDSKLYILKIVGTITNPDITDFETNFKPMLIAKTDSKTQVFPIESIEEGTSIQLRGVFPADFLDTPVTIVGIVPQETIYVDQKTNTSKMAGTSQTQFNLQREAGDSSAEEPGNTGNQDNSDNSENSNNTDNSDNKENDKENSTTPEDETNDTDNNENTDNTENNETDNTEETKKYDIKEIHWLSVTPMSVAGYSSGTFEIPSSAQTDGIDFSKKAN